jgi:acyl-CoA thioesterase
MTELEAVQEMADEEFFRELIKYRNSGANFFASYIGIDITEIGLGWAVGEINLEQHHYNPIGSIHGGCLFALADSVGGSAACSRRRPVTTVNSSISYVTAAMNTKKLVAKAAEIKAGKKTCVYRVDIFNDDGVLLVTSTMTYFYLKGEIRFPGAD